MRRRTYAPVSGKRDTHEGERWESIRIYILAVAGGGIMGFVAGLRAGHPILGFLIGTATVVGVVRLVMEFAGRGATLLYNPSGKTTPHTKEYSYALALVQKGRFDDAVLEMEREIAEDPSAVEPYLLLARLLRRDMSRSEEAVAVLRRAQRAARLNSGQGLFVRREVVEISRDDLGRPEMAAPELAQLAESHKDHPEGAWARDELARVKQIIAKKHED